MKKPTVYLSGPMTGWENFNKDWFDAEERKFKNLGWRVLNPHSFMGESFIIKMADRYPKLSWSIALLRDLSVLVVGDLILDVFCVYAHRKYKKSYGAMIEVAVADKFGIPIVLEEIQ